MSGTQQYAGTTITAAASEEIKKLAESSQKDYLEAHKNANGVQNKDNVPGFTVRCLCDESTNTASVVTPVGITKLATFAKLPKKTVIPGDDDNDSSSSDEDDGEGESGARETASSPALASSSSNSDSAASATAPNGSAVCGDPVSGDSLRTEKLRAALRELPNPRLLKLTTPASAWNVMFSPDLKYTSIVTDSLDVTIVPVGRPAEAFTVRAAAPSLQPSFSRIAAAFSSFSSSSTPPTPPRVLGCVWPYSDTFVVVTTETVEAYTVRGTRVTLAKAFCYKITWFKYSRKHRVILALVAQNTLQPLDFSIRGEYTKLSRIELVKAPESGFVPSEHVGVVDICSESFVAQLAWSEKKLPQPCITLIPFNKDLSVVRLLIPYGPERDGSVRFQSVDNLLVVHDLMHKVSFFYDLTLAGLPIIPCPVIVQPRQAAALAQEPVPAPVLYSEGAVFTGESKIVDIRDGSLWELNVNLEKLTRDIEDKALLVNFLLRRAGGKQHVMRVVREMILSHARIQDISTVFDCINRVFLVKIQEQRDLEREVEQQLPHDAKIRPSLVEVQQSDLFEYFFSSVDEDKTLTPEYIIAVLTEYIRSLSFNRVPAEPYLYGKLIQVLVRSHKFYQLHQLIQYHVICDSVHVACKLLSLEAQYPPAFQLALDMFKRLDEGDHIVEVLLAKKDIISTLRFIQSNPRVCVQPHRLLEIAKDLDDPALLYTVFKFFEKRKDLPEGYVLDDPRLLMSAH